MPAGCCLHTFPAFKAACKLDCQWKQKISSKKKKKRVCDAQMFLKIQWKQIKCCFYCKVHLEGELLIEDGVEGLPVDLGLKFLLLVRQQVDLYVWVRCATHVHSRQLGRLNDPHHELRRKRGHAES